MNNFDRRPRGRNQNRRNGRRSSGPRSLHVIKTNDQGRSYNQNRVKFNSNGNATKLFEKYTKLASEALATGEKILAEHYFQHADHFARIMPQQTEIKKSAELEEEKDEDSAVSDEVNSSESASLPSNEDGSDSETNTVVAKTSE